MKYTNEEFIKEAQKHYPIGSTVKSLYDQVFEVKDDRFLLTEDGDGYWGSGTRYIYKERLGGEEIWATIVSFPKTIENYDIY